MSLTPEKALELYLHFSDRTDAQMARAVIVATACVGIKLLDVQVSELDFPGLKLSLANARILTGVLGLATAYFLFTSIMNLVSAHRLKQYFNDDLKLLVAAPTGLIPNIFLTLPMATLFMIFFITVIFAIWLVFSDMVYLVETIVARMMGWESYIGAWDTCITKPKS